jgi:hypothetical protein
VFYILRLARDDIGYLPLNICEQGGLPAYTDARLQLEQDTASRALIPIGGRFWSGVVARQGASKPMDSCSQGRDVCKDFEPSDFRTCETGVAVASPSMYYGRGGLVAVRRKSNEHLAGSRHMSRYWRHVTEQGAGVGALLGLVSTTVARTIAEKAGKHTTDPPAVGASVRRGIHLPDVSLQRDFVRFCGGDPARYSGFTPPHLFSQWVLPVALRFAERLPYAPLAVVNLGCDLKIHGPIPQSGRVEVQCTLTHLETNADRVKITLRLATLFKNEALLTCGLHLLARLSKPPSPSRREKEQLLVAANARELTRRSLRRDAGLEFAQLTGDFNPIHWSAAYARVAGFRSNILHGFCSLSLATEALVTARLSGDWRAIRRLDARFLAPLTLPHTVGVYWDNGSLAVGDGVGGPAYMAARVELA